ncbi:MAG: hypothetical protein KatS3mg060_1157 [Dehalococcoidia bacterium]|nr:MAG: hypothetical protein KatS3mg060_1157 [Dehalococcoidia bacterium]
MTNDAMRDITVPQRIAERLMTFMLDKQRADAAYQAALTITVAAMGLDDDRVLGAVVRDDGAIALRLAAATTDDETTEVQSAQA